MKNSSLAKLQNINLSENKLEIIPEELGEFK
jgi:hypothetical protein